MTRTKKTLVAAAFAVALGIGGASPALAENHAGDTPVTTQENHAGVVTTQENHAG
ncbi:hypothetical protein [Streptomyces sp. NPDC005780]|uniref:hypothetical protein n=1 Tax=Streptomyces sp. NPDC005780 TaxID=3364730 RepID=UPI0036BDA2F4